MTFALFPPINEAERKAQWSDIVCKINTKCRGKLKGKKKEKPSA